MRNTNTNYIRSQLSRRRDRRITVRVDLVGWHPDDLSPLASYLESATLPAARELGADLRDRIDDAEAAAITEAATGLAVELDESIPVDTIRLRTPEGAEVDIINIGAGE